VKVIINYIDSARSIDYTKYIINIMCYVINFLPIFTGHNKAVTVTSNKQQVRIPS